LLTESADVDGSHVGATQEESRCEVDALLKRLAQKDETAGYPAYYPGALGNTAGPWAIPRGPR